MTWPDGVDDLLLTKGAARSPSSPGRASTDVSTRGHALHDGAETAPP